MRAVARLAPLRRVAVVGVRALRRRAPDGQLGLGVAPVRRAGAMGRLAARQGRSSSIIAAAKPSASSRESSRLVRLSLSRARIVAVPSRFLREVFARSRRGRGSRAEHRGSEAVRAARTAAERCRAAPHVVVTRNLEAIYDNETAIRALALVRRPVPGVPHVDRRDRPGTRAAAAGRGRMRCRRRGDFLGRLEREAIAALYRERRHRAQSEPRRQHAEFDPRGARERSARREHARRRRALHGRPRPHGAAGSAAGSAGDGRRHRAPVARSRARPPDRERRAAGRPAVRMAGGAREVDRDLCAG